MAPSGPSFLSANEFSASLMGRVIDKQTGPAQRRCNWMKKLNFITLLGAEKSTSNCGNRLRRLCQQFALSQCLFHPVLIYQSERGSRPFPLPSAVCCFLQLLMVYFHHNESYKWAMKERRKTWLRYANFSNFLVLWSKHRSLKQHSLIENNRQIFRFDSLTH